MLSENLENFINSDLFPKTDFVNIDKSDVEFFINNVDMVDLRTIECSIEEVVEKFRVILQEVKNDNLKYDFSALLFIVNFSDQINIKIEDFLFVDNLLDVCGDSVDCIWGMSENKQLCSGFIGLKILFGFNSIV